ncbi:DUF3040 domain-containing protein [Paractinoplanes rishiriensis]|uniref:DUF3040 domain-containing protein n=1 Tax=Paractinoplanes rishiriensis TaxID=1050105 RepID=A0A919MV89_9ACTN|nr:DUF3040 domain-containing protein [Actinoplanes rishiriensis]GIF01152.1 hypothetical protein Ari01nite_86160 [Actinoplanes rishiriensis]
MPNSYYRLRFDTIIRELTDDDPAFVRRVNGLPHSRLRRRRLWAWLLWAAIPLLVVVGGWTGALIALIALAGSAVLWRGTGRIT